jgi:hypothetical protein
MEDEKIIPTQYKSKIPNTLSFPIGAKAISEALLGVPQFSEISVHFSFSNQLARHHGTSTAYQVIDVWFRGPTRSIFASLSVEEQISRCPIWTIGVHAIPRSLRHVIKTKIMTEALPSIRRWFLENPHSKARKGVHWLTL